jgi:hypothetical protein
MTRSSLHLLLLVMLGACASTVDGPSPTISSVAPTPICDAQHATSLTIKGTGFSPIVRDGLTDHPSVVMPRVLLVGGSASTEVPVAGVTVPDATGTTLVVTIPQSLVAPGMYGVEVIDPDGHDTTLANGLTIDPPPHITSINPAHGPAGSTAIVTLTGTGFLSGMTVTLGATPPVPGTNVTASADGTSATVTFNLTGVAPGTYSITVDNGDGCTDTLAASFTVGHSFAITGIDPPFGCMCSETNVTIGSSGGFVSTPRVELRPAGQAGPVTLMTRVAFVDTSTLTAVVPMGLALGLYDVTVVNPPSDGGIAQLANGFRVVARPAPQIDAIVPSRGAPNTTVAVSIFGANYRNPVKVELLDRTLAVVATVASVAPVSPTRIDTSLALPAIEDAYLVRVTDLDEMTYSTFSAFIVGSNGSSGKLHGFTVASTLVTGRRMHGGTLARDDLGNTFTYVFGGDTGGAAPTVLDSVEVSQLSKFGALGAWHQIRTPNRLTTTRDAPAVVTVPLFDPQGSPFIPVKTYLYATGGRNAAGTVLGSVERAMVLRNADAPKVTSAAVSATVGTLAAGTWYYKVSAILAASDPDNPGGETLSSDEAILTIDANKAIDLAWNPVMVNGTAAVMYRVYRTAMADGASQQELLIATVTGTSYTDTGATVQTDGPLPSGAVGVWRAQVPAHAARWGHQAAVITDGTGARFIYELGGKSTPTTGYLATIEVAPIDVFGHLGAFGSTGTTSMLTARAFFSLVVETAANVAGFTGVARLITTGGVEAGAASNEVEFTDATAGGGNGAWTATGLSLNTRAGVMSVIASNKLFCLGGASATTDTAFANILQTGRNVGFNIDGTIGSPMQSTASAFPNPLALGASITGSGFIYFAGGTTDGIDAVNTVYQTF